MTGTVLIIGGGIVGTSIAYQLARYNLSVILIDKEVELSFGVSKSNSGIVHTGFQAGADTLKGKLAVVGNRLYEDLSAELDFPFKRIGELVVGQREDLGRLEEMKKNGEALGIPGLKIVDRKWLGENEPKLSKRIEYALLGPTAGVINPYETIYALAESAGLNGVLFKLAEKVNSISRGGKQWEVTTSKESYTADIVINAAGLFADEVAAMAGCTFPKVLPRKGEEFLLDRHAGTLTDRIIFPLPTPVSKGILIIPTVDGNYMIGPTAEANEDKYDLSTSSTGKKMVIEHVQRLVEDIDPSQIIASFAGLRPSTAHGDFYIKEDAPGFINLIGIDSPGLTAAPAIAVMVEEMVAAYLPLTAKTGYHKGRCAIPRFRELSSRERNSLIASDPDFGEVICRCELVTKGEIKEAIRRGARTLDGIKFRTRSQMGRCHGAFCTAKIMNIISEELGIPLSAITKRGQGSEIII